MRFAFTKDTELPSDHAFTRANQTRWSAEKGKFICLIAFNKSALAIMYTLHSLAYVHEETEQPQIYPTGTNI